MEIPSPIPPWHRPVQTPLVQVITGDDEVNLGVDTTYLVQETQQDGDAPYLVTLPDGNYLRQIKRIYVRGDVQPTSAPFKMSGTFVSGAFFLFNTTATAAVLEWDGTAWQLIGGNAQPSDT